MPEETTPAPHPSAPLPTLEEALLNLATADHLPPDAPDRDAKVEAAREQYRAAYARVYSPARNALAARDREERKTRLEEIDQQIAALVIERMELREAGRTPPGWFERLPFSQMRTAFNEHVAGLKLRSAQIWPGHPERRRFDIG